MKVLVFGKTGQVAQSLARFDGVQTIGREVADLTQPGVCADVVLASDADVVINAAAYTGVDAAENDEPTAQLINADAPGAMARAAASRGIPFLHISTDYVFDGSGDRPWREDDATGPLGVYGATKLAGEQAVAAEGGSHAILRTSWVVSGHGNNFVKTMLRLGAERDALNVVCDQIGGPTPAHDIAPALLAIAKELRGNRDFSGIYHFAGAPNVSWADFAREIFAQAHLRCDVSDIPTSQYPTPAARPANSRLDCSKLVRTFGIAQPDWRLGLTQILQNLGARA